MRIIGWICALWLAWPLGLWAQTAALRGGEHPDFTRLVLHAPGLKAWQLGRIDTGYAITFGGAAVPVDLSAAFEKIPKDRISGIWQDEGQSGISFAIACACHATAFDFRPGIVVIDIRNGPADPGSAFETSVAAGEGIGSRAPVNPLPHPKSQPRISDKAADAEGSPEAEPDLLPLRSALIERINIGAAEGLIDMAEPASDKGGDQDEKLPGTRISLGELPGLKVQGSDPAITAEGAICPPDTALDLAGWMPPGAVAQVLSTARGDLYGEFDKLDSEAALHGAQIYLALGFGAEARQLLMLAPDPESDTYRSLIGLSYLLDLEAAPQSAFLQDAACDSDAALWSAMAWALHPGPVTTLPNLNKKAFLRGFSALPLHLRRTIAPVLSDYFVRAGDQATALQLRDATVRGAHWGDAGVALMEVQIDLAQGDSLAAETGAKAVLAQSGSASAEAAIALTQAAFLGNRKVSPDLPDQLEALRVDVSGAKAKAEIDRALVLAAAMAGQYPRAFARMAEAKHAAADLWLLAADAAEDADFLPEALNAARLTPPVVASPVAVLIADRLTALGFPTEALLWLGPERPNASLDWHLSAAQAHLALRNGRGAMRVLAGIADPMAEPLRAAAALQIGDAETAVAAYRRAAMEGEALGALRRAGHWQEIAAFGDDTWQPVAQIASASPIQAISTPDIALPFAAETAIADHAQTTTAAILSLLDSLPVPPGNFDQNRSR